MPGMTLTADAPTTDGSESLATDTSRIVIPSQDRKRFNQPTLVRSRMAPRRHESAGRRTSRLSCRYDWHSIDFSGASLGSLCFHAQEFEHLCLKRRGPRGHLEGLGPRLLTVEIEITNDEPSDCEADLIAYGTLCDFDEGRYSKFNIRCRQEVVPRGLSSQ